MNQQLIFVAGTGPDVESAIRQASGALGDRIRETAQRMPATELPVIQSLSHQLNVTQEADETGDLHTVWAASLYAVVNFPPPLTLVRRNLP